jgi:hypothetical protein
VLVLGLTLYTTHNFSCFHEDNLGNTPAALDVQTKDYFSSSVIHASPPPYQNHPLWCRWLDQTNHIKKHNFQLFGATECVLKDFLKYAIVVGY